MAAPAIESKVEAAYTAAMESRERVRRASKEDLRIGMNAVAGMLAVESTDNMVPFLHAMHGEGPDGDFPDEAEKYIEIEGQFGLDALRTVFGRFTPKVPVVPPTHAHIVPRSDFDAFMRRGQRPPLRDTYSAVRYRTVRQGDHYLGQVYVPTVRVELKLTDEGTKLGEVDTADYVITEVVRGIDSIAPDYQDNKLPRTLFGTDLAGWARHYDLGVYGRAVVGLDDAKTALLRA